MGQKTRRQKVIAEYMSTIGAKGGASRSDRKRRAVIANLAKARAQHTLNCKERLEKQ